MLLESTPHGDCPSYNITLYSPDCVAAYSKAVAPGMSMPWLRHWYATAELATDRNTTAVLPQTTVSPKAEITAW
jgi:hypothetical protein